MVIEGRDNYCVYSRIFVLFEFLASFVDDGWHLEEQIVEGFNSIVRVGFDAFIEGLEIVLAMGFQVLEEIVFLFIFIFLDSEAIKNEEESILRDAWILLIPIHREEGGME